MEQKTISKLFEKRNKTITLIIILLIGFLLLEVAGISKYIETPIQKVFSPVQIALYKTKQDFLDFTGTLGQIGQLREKESKLSKENALLLAENATLKKLEKENKILRGQLGAKKFSKKLIVAKIIGQDPLVMSSQLLVDKGESDGVDVGALVILENILVGKVVTVEHSTSTVRLLTDPETKIPAVTTSGVRGIVKGEFGNKIVLEKIVQGKKIKTGEIVFSSGEADFPKGLVLGKIAQVKTKPAAIFQKAMINPLILHEELETIFILERVK